MLGSFKTIQAQEQLLELLGVMESLSPDPRTVCSAMLFVGMQNGEQLDPWKPDLPESVWTQLSGLLRLKQMELENIPAGTERSAEGLRRLLLALVKDVRVVLIALAWQLVQFASGKGR